MLTARLLWVAALVLAIDVVAVGLHYGRDLGALQQEVLERQSDRIRRALESGADGTVTVDAAATRLFRAHTDAYGFVVVDGAGRALASANLALVPAPARKPAPGLDTWSANLAGPEGAVRVRGERIEIGGAPAALVVVKAGDPAGLTTGALLNELMGHVLLPVVPAVLALLVANVVLVRRCVRPLAAAAAWARAVVPGAPPAPPPEGPLPREAADLVEAARRALEGLEATLAAEKRRAAEAAHALRTPLAVMTTRLDAMPGTEETARLRADLAGLSRTVAQVLSSARAGALVVAPDATADLSAIAEDVVAALAPLGWQAGVALELHAPGHAVPVAGDAGAIEMALSNLVENAIRHAGARTVRVHVRPGGGIRVEDDGRGIPAAEAGLLFEPFSRGPDAAAGGAGLGLAIVARVARAHDAVADYRRLPRGGSAFSLDFAEHRRKS